MKLSAKIFLENNDKSYILGPGRVALLKATESLGSLHKAAQAVGMSYRWAWGRLRTAEKELGINLLTSEGESGRGKTKALSPEARELLKWYKEMEDKVAAVLADSAEKSPLLKATINPELI